MKEKHINESNERCVLLQEINKKLMSYDCKLQGLTMILDIYRKRNGFNKTAYVAMDSKTLKEILKRL